MECLLVNWFIFQWMERSMLSTTRSQMQNTVANPTGPLRAWCGRISSKLENLFHTPYCSLSKAVHPLCFPINGLVPCSIVFEQKNIFLQADGIGQEWHFWYPSRLPAMGCYAFLEGWKRYGRTGNSKRHQGFVWKIYHGMATEIFLNWLVSKWVTLFSAVSYRVGKPTRKVRTAKGSAPVNSRVLSNQEHKVPQKITVCLWWIRVKTWGKSSRQQKVIFVGGKPCVLKCHIGHGNPWLEGGPPSLAEAMMGRQLDSQG